MSRTVKHPPKPDRFTSRDRTGKHAKQRKLRAELFRVAEVMTLSGRRGRVPE